MAERPVADSGGKEHYRITGIVWKSPITRGPLSGRGVRSVVGLDQNGTYRAGEWFGPDRKTGEKMGMSWGPEAFKNKESAIWAPRENIAHMLEGEVRQAAEKVIIKAPSQILAQAKTHNWSVEIRAPEQLPGAETNKILDSFGRPKRYRVGKFPSGGRKMKGPSR